jgi:hypothetical protein
MWLHVTAFSTFPFRRTGEGNFYQQQHHQHRRFFYHGKHFYSAATGTQGRSFSALLDPTSRDTLDVLFLLFRFFFLFSACFFLRFLRFFAVAFLFSWGMLLLLFATRRCYETQNNEQRQEIYHTQKLQRRQYAGFMLFLPSNQFSLSLFPSSCPFFLSLLQE